MSNDWKLFVILDKVSIDSNVHQFYFYKVNEKDIDAFYERYTSETSEIFQLGASYIDNIVVREVIKFNPSNQ